MCTKQDVDKKSNVQEKNDKKNRKLLWIRIFDFCVLRNDAFYTNF